ncbi:MAG: hydrogenase subunit MbhD domain-containing protein [Desulfobacterales bacterium]
MHWEIELLMLLVMIVAAMTALHIKSLLAAVVTLNIFSFMSAGLMVSMGAIDVAFTEAVVGAGAVGIFNILAIFCTTRTSLD